MLRSFTVAVPITATPLATLLRALPNWPTISAGSQQSQSMPVGNVSQITLSAPTTNAAGFVYVGGPGLTATNAHAASLAPGGSYVLGSASELAVDIYSIYVMSTGAATDLLLIGLVG